MSSISIIVPVLNEADCIESCLQSLQSLRKHYLEVILVDGGSEDDTRILAKPLVDKLLETDKGRARQLNFGAQNASGELLVFLHADTLLSEQACVELLRLSGEARIWGRFDVKLSGKHYLFRIIEFFMNLRSRLSGIATGDQVIFCSRSLFEDAGGFPDIALMEDISFSSRLKKMIAPVCCREKVLTSSRRWEEKGIVKTMIKMQCLRLRYALGASPEILATEYDG